MESCEVLIVGGGPAGSSCAWRLRKCGLDVLVVDKKVFPRDKPCAGWITPAVIDELELDVQEYRQGRIFQPIFGFRSRLIGGPEVESRYDRPVSFGIRRCEFDHYLLKRSAARLELGEPVRSLRRDGSQWILNDRIRASVVVGAGGHFCPVARHLGARPGVHEEPVMAQEFEVVLDHEQAAACPVSAEVPEIAFCRDLKGYGWCFRKGGVLNVGLGRQDSHRLSEHVEAFRDRLVAEGRIPACLSARFVGHAYLLRAHAPRRVVDDQVMLVGDAAGLAYRQSGEGIRPAVESGLLAADTLLAARGRFDRVNLEPYAQRLDDRFGKPWRGRKPPDLIPAHWKALLGGWMLGVPWFARNVVFERWFLHAHEAPIRLGAVPADQPAALAPV